LVCVTDCAAGPEKLILQELRIHSGDGGRVVDLVDRRGEAESIEGLAVSIVSCVRLIDLGSQLTISERSRFHVHLFLQD